MRGRRGDEADAGSSGARPNGIRRNGAIFVVALAAYALGELLRVAGVLSDAPVPQPVMAVALGIVGLEIGLRIDRAAVRAVRRMLPVISALTAGLMAGCAGLGILLSVLTGVPPVDAHLMTTPGGINAVLAAAVSLKGVDLALITLAQTLRMLAMVVIAPRLIRWMGPSSRRPAGTVPRPAAQRS